MFDFKSTIACIRWSDPKQSEGSSERQQRTAIERECRDLGLHIEQWVADKGRSAFHGKHISHGDFCKLLDEIDAGEHAGNVSEGPAFILH